jgi:hypothetical protein
MTKKTTAKAAAAVEARQKGLVSAAALAHAAMLPHDPLPPRRMRCTAPQRRSLRLACRVLSGNGRRLLNACGSCVRGDSQQTSVVRCGAVRCGAEPEKSPIMPPSTPPVVSTVGSEWMEVPGPLGYGAIPCMPSENILIPFVPLVPHVIHTKKFTYMPLSGTQGMSIKSDGIQEIFP